MDSLNKSSLPPPPGKGGEELLHEVAARYVEGMKDMDGRKPGPSSILGETFNNHIASICSHSRDLTFICSFRSLPAEAWRGRGLQSAL